MSIFHEYYYLPKGKHGYENMIEEKSIINKALFSFFGIRPKGRRYYNTEGMFRTTYKEQLNWALFGEWKFIYWLMGLRIALIIGFLYIAFHFITKYW